MKFSTKLPAIYGKRVIRRALKSSSQRNEGKDSSLFAETASTERCDKSVLTQKGAKNGKSFGSFSKSPKTPTLVSSLRQKVQGNDFIARFNLENDLIFGRLLNSSAKDQQQSEKETKGQKKKTLSKVAGKSAEAQDIFDFPQLLRVLPKKDRLDSVTSFPLLNPWRLGQFSPLLDKSEEQVQKKREALLDSTFPASNFPSVTKVLQATLSDSSRAALENWKQKMIAELGEEGFLQHKRQLFHRGSLLHRNIALHLQGQTDLSIAQEIEAFWSSLRSVFVHLNDVRLLERHVTHPFLCYKGVADCVALYEEQLVLIDWKTSSRAKPSLSNLFDEPLQAVAYVGALNYDKQINFQVEQVALVIAYDDGSPAKVHHLSHSRCREYWSQWLGRLKNYWDSL